MICIQINRLKSHEILIKVSPFRNNNNETKRHNKYESVEPMLRSGFNANISRKNLE